MPREPDWMDFAHALDKKREQMQDALPSGFICCLTLSSYQFGGGRFNVSIWHEDKSKDLNGYGDGATPAKALEAAKEDMKKRAAEKAKRPQLGGAKALPAKKET